VCVTEADVIRWAGVSVGVFGALIVAPTGVLLVLQDARALVLAVWSAIRNAWDRFILRKKKPAPAVYATGGVAAAKATVGGALVVRHHGAPVDEQLRLLWDEVDRLGGLIRKVDEGSKGRDEAAAAMIGRESDARRRLRAELAARHERDERQSARVNARGLPLIGLGIVMTGIPDGLATWAWVGWLFIAAAGLLVIAVAFWGAFRWRQRRREAKA
jgi:hypothetical protein